jgi:hypothetical protein
MQHKIAKCRRHALHFGREVLNKPVEMLLAMDERLRELANLGLPTLVNPYFDTEDSSDSSSGDDDEDGPHNQGPRRRTTPSVAAPQVRRLSPSLPLRLHQDRGLASFVSLV